MKETIYKCSCDYCDKEMELCEYEETAQLTLRIELSNPRGSGGNSVGINMRICDDCLNELGIVNSYTKYHETLNSRNNLGNSLKKCKIEFLKYFSKRDGKKQ